MNRTIMVIVVAVLLSACESSSPCGPGQRLAENDRAGAKIQYCVRKDDGRAQGRYTCTLHENRGTVIGTFDANFKHGEWRYLVAGKPVLYLGASGNHLMTFPDSISDEGDELTPALAALPRFREQGEGEEGQEDSHLSRS